VAKLEVVARKYLELSAGRSQTLEWVLIDALMYCECVAYAQTVLTDKTLLGLALPSELKGVSAGANFKKALKVSAKQAAVEVVALAAAGLIAAVLAQSNTEAFWIIMVGVTGARWIRSAVLKHGVMTPGMERGKLLLRMVAVHKLLKAGWFSAQHIRDQLNRAADAGADFSSSVFELLDARIRSEQTSARRA
jgi:hypothetical protein